MSDEVDMDWVEKVSSEALSILQHGLMRGISTMLDTRGAAGVDRMGLESLWYAVLVLEFVARSAVRESGVPTQVQLDLMRASKTIGGRIFKEAKLDEILSDEGIKSMEDVIAEMSGELNTADIGEA